MKKKIMDINEQGIHLVCIKDTDAKGNPYRLYQITYDNGWHRRMIAKYENFASIMYHIAEFNGIWR